MYKKLMKLLIHYGIIPFGIIGLLLYVFHNVIFNKIYNDLRSSLNISRAPLHKFITIVQIALWLIFYLFYLREIIYKDITGRGYLGDSYKYKMGFFALINYFKDADDKKIKDSELINKYGTNITKLRKRIYC